MKKYRRKPGVVDAEQFLPDKKPWPEGVKQYYMDRWHRDHGHKSYCLGDPPAHLGMGCVEVNSHDWILTKEGGEKFVYGYEDFKEIYEEVKK